MSVTHYPIVLLPPDVVAVQTEPALEIPQPLPTEQIQPPSQVDLRLKREQWRNLVGIIVVGLATAGVLTGLGAANLAVLAFISSLVVSTDRARRILKRTRHQYQLQKHRWQEEQVVWLLNQGFEEACQEAQAEQRRKRVLNVLAQTVLADGQGKSKTNRVERILFTRLDRYFPGKMHRELTLSRPATSYPFYPDMAYVDAALGLCIDIEMDEPYVYNSRQPIHYQGKDDDRDQFFLQQGWLVMRFTEEQAVLHPEACGKVIATTIAELTGDRSVLSLFDAVPNLEPVPRWTHEQAADMALRNARDQYLSTLPSYFPTPTKKPLLKEKPRLTA